MRKVWKAGVAALATVSMVGCATTSSREECELRRAEIAAAAACRADAACAAKGFTFPQIEGDQDYVAQHCRGR